MPPALWIVYMDESHETNLVWKYSCHNLATAVVVLGRPEMLELSCVTLWVCLKLNMRGRYCSVVFLNEDREICPYLASQTCGPGDLFSVKKTPFSSHVLPLYACTIYAALVSMHYICNTMMYGLVIYSTYVILSTSHYAHCMHVKKHMNYVRYVGLMWWPLFLLWHLCLGGIWQGF